MYNSSITRTASLHFHLLKNLEKEVKFSHTCLTAISLLCMPSSCYQRGKIHLLNQHQPVKKCAAEKNHSSNTEHNSKNGSGNISKNLYINSKLCTDGMLNCTMFLFRDFSNMYLKLEYFFFFLAVSHAHNLIHSLIASPIHQSIHSLTNQHKSHSLPVAVHISPVTLSPTVCPLSTFTINS